MEIDNKCKYCYENEDKQTSPGLRCIDCHNFVHLMCLKSITPGDLTDDVFFEYSCEACCPDGKEVFNREKVSWVTILYLSLHHLAAQSIGISKQGFFHYKTHICSFVYRNWDILFGTKSFRKKNWVGTIAGALSTYSSTLFQSGSTELGEAGWWRLKHSFSPALAAHIMAELVKDKPKGVKMKSLNNDKYFFAKIRELGYEHLISVERTIPVERNMAVERNLAVDNSDVLHSTAPQPAEPPLKRRRIKTEHYFEVEPEASTSASEYIAMDNFDDNSISRPSEEYYASEGSPPPEPAFMPLLPHITAVHQNYWAHSDSDSKSVSSPNPIVDQQSEDDDRQTNEPINERIYKPSTCKKHTEKPIIRTSLFSSQLNSVDLPWMSGFGIDDATKVKVKEEGSKLGDQESAYKDTEAKLVVKKEKDLKEEATTNLVEMTHYAEVQLLKQIEGLLPRVQRAETRAYLHRLKAKLALRRLKRHRHLPAFNFDEVVKRLTGNQLESCTVEQDSGRVLDRFQSSLALERLCGTVAAVPSGMAWVRSAAVTHSRSPYSGALLKPYIRRDFTSTPRWAALMDELLQATAKQSAGRAPRTRPALDYSYVQPHHVPALNSLCAQFFWPGLDLSEALQYPEYCCVCTWGHVCVGAAVLLPEVAPSTAYLSFLVTHPHFRRAGIATFMLYHVLQTCPDKDIILHVSPTNPAVFLYQKFGFKVEELVQDFYEKYYDVEYKGCRHALLLRLNR